jgi:chemotaxis protein methyltransferase CheR
MGWMFGKAGLDISVYRPSALQRRLPACLRQLRVASPESARTLLECRPELLPLALNALLIGVSDFFRDAPVFGQLQTVVLPALLRSRPGIRVCSVGVSGGQELYSVAMLLAELAGLGGSRLMGIDCRSHAIAHAAAGDFRPEEMAGVEPARRERFFERAGGCWRIRPELRSQVRWEVADLFSFAGPGPWDLILFRNVAIYLDDSPAVRAWERLEARLAPGGVLVTGKAERPPGWLGLVRIGPSIYRKPAP